MSDNRYFGRVVPMGDPTVAFSTVEPAHLHRRAGNQPRNRETEVEAETEEEAWTNLGRS